MKSFYIICSTGIVLMIAALLAVFLFGCSHHKSHKSKKNPPINITVYPSEKSKDRDPIEIKEPTFNESEKDPYNFPKPNPNPRGRQK